MDGLKLLSLLFLAATFTHGEESQEPRVAFMCGRPSMHSTQRGHVWVKDDDSDCLQDPVDILNYCKKIYPNLDVRNIVESTEKVTIKNWCDYGVSQCNKEYTVSPFRCLVGAFQSDALLVPEHCVFDHIHDSKRCVSFQEWNITAMKSCQARGLVQQSFAMLQPCKTDRFSGVEFVCCPTKQDVKDSNVVVSSEEDKPMKKKEEPKKIGSSDSSEEAESKSGEDESSYGRYVQRQGEKGGKFNERESFLKAKEDMRKHHHDKIEKNLESDLIQEKHSMMSDWAAARQRVQELKQTDMKQSEKLNKEITSRFQKMYEAEESERSSERQQLNQLHEQRVQAGIMENKEQAFDEYVNAIAEKSPDAVTIMKTLKRYIKTLHKDRMHTLNHYEHVEDTDPEQSDTIHAETAEHLRRVDQQLTDALSLLNRVPNMKNKILKQLEVFLEAYHSMDRDVALVLLTQPSRKDETKQSDNKSNKKSDDSDDSADEVDKDDDKDDDDDDDDDDDSYDDEDWEDERTYDSVTKKPVMVEKTTRRVVAPVVDEIKSEELSKVEVDDVIYHNLPSVDHQKDAANINKDVYSVNEVAYLKKSSLHDSTVGLGSGVPLAIAVGSLTIIVVIVVGVLIMRRRRHRYARPLRLNLDPIGDEVASPEERHMASMQMSGYENPTYKFFEQQGASA